MKNTTKCTLTQLAGIVGVGPSTVSRVLNNSYSKVKITDDTIRKIHAAVKEYGYTPNINARRLLKNRSFVIGLEIPSGNVGNHTFADHTFVETMRGIEEVIVNSEYKMLILFKNEKYMNTQENVKLLREKAIDGLLVWGASYLDNYADAMTEHPVIFLNGRPKLKNINFIGHDNFNASCELTEYAISQGARKFLYFSGPGARVNSIDEDRYNGFMAALVKHQLTLEPENFIQAQFRHDPAAELMDQILTGKKLQFDTVICANDSMAAGVYDAAQRHGLRIPDSFRLAGADGVHDIYDNLQLTTIAVDSFSLGALAIRKMIGMVEGKEDNCHDIYLKAQLLKRKTL
ncbi:MAG: LacI family DNA-binding transcriptional regulator [Victivallaceae bacterium]|jgi:DNA-binding LacI/PurR family transcriptional regulator